MSDTKHTPGPWRYQGEVEIDPLGRTPKRTLYQVYTAAGKYGHPATCENEADARLIAAAVDLLTALESAPMPHVCGWRDRCEVDSKRPLCDHCEYRFWYEGPRVAALAKVKA